MAKDKKLTKEEIEKQREEYRKVALKNLAENKLTDLAAAYLVEKNGQYGDAIGSAIEQYKYFPAINSGAKVYDFKTGEEVDIMKNALLGSRQDGKRYTGNISEYNIIKDCAQIIQESLMGVKIQDVLELIGSDKEVIKNYKDKYLSDLAESKEDEDKEVFETVLNGYMQYLTDTKVSESLNNRTNAIKGGLEKILCGESN